MYAQKRTEGSNPSLSATPVKKAASRGLLYGRGTNGGFEPEWCYANGSKKSFTAPDGVSYAHTYYEAYPFPRTVSGRRERRALQSPSLGYPFETAFLAHRDHLSFFE